MKIDIIDDNELIIYLYNKIDNYNFKDELCIEKCLRKLFIKLNDYYDIKIEGYYNVDLYIDIFYGIVLVLKKEDIEYYDYFDNHVDMKITINKNKFFYLIDNYNIDLKKFDIYKVLDSIYLLPKKRLKDIELANLIENSKIIYNSEEIIKKGIKISV